MKTVQSTSIAACAALAVLTGCGQLTPTGSVLPATRTARLAQNAIEIVVLEASSVRIGGVDVFESEAGDALRRRGATRDTRILLRTDARVSPKRIAQLLSRLRNAGYWNVSFAGR